MLSRNKLKMLPLTLGLVVWVAGGVYVYFDERIGSFWVGLGAGAPFALGVTWFAQKIVTFVLTELAHPQQEVSAGPADRLAHYWAAHPEEKARYFAQHPELRRRSRWVLTWVAVSLALGLIGWVIPIIDSAQQHPGDPMAWADGIWTGLGIAVITVAITGSIGMYFLANLIGTHAKVDFTALADSAGTGDAELDKTLAEMDAVRRQLLEQMSPEPPFPLRYAVTGALVCAVCFWWALGPTNDPQHLRHSLLVHILGNLILLALFAGFGWLMGMGFGYERYRRLAPPKPSPDEVNAAYGNLYQQRVLPQLAARFGRFAWRPARPPLDEFKRYRLFAPWDSASAGDEMTGEYHGLPLAVGELRLGYSQNSAADFAGLVVTLALPRGLRGVTVVIPGAQSVFADFAERWRGQGDAAAAPLQPVHLEDPAFAQAFQVHATDQVSSRALLTPAFMHRFTALANRLGAPALLVQDNRLIMAVTTGRRDFFQPPDFREPATARSRLTRQRDDIATLLRVADAVIDLDQSARQQAAQVS